MGSRCWWLSAALTSAVGYVSVSGTSVAAEFGFRGDSAEEARLYQLGFMILLSGTVIWNVLERTGHLAMASKQVASAWEVAGLLVCCALFMVVGPALMLLNKQIMQEHDFPFPLTLSGVGVLASSFVAYAASWTGLASVNKETEQMLSSASGYARTVLPIAALRACTLATGNAAYLYLSLGFVQMLKAFTPSIILVVMLVFGVKRPTRAAVWCVFVIVSGTMVEVRGELHATGFGIAVMMMSIFSEAVNTVLTQRLLQDFRFSEFETMYYLAPASLLVLILPACILEWGELVRRERYMIFMERPATMLAACLLGIGVNFLTLKVVKATSSVTVKILNTLRCIGLVGVGMAFYGETHTTAQLFGYGVSLAGFLGYNYFQLFGDRAQVVEEWVDRKLYGKSRETPATMGPSVAIGAQQ